MVDAVALLLVVWTTSVPPGGLRPSGSQPLFTVDLLSAALAAATAVNAARRAYARHRSVEEVRRTIAAYCDAQPNGGAGIQICSTSPAIR